MPLAKDERIYGLGDVSRENIMRRGGVYEIWVRNVNSYIPIPVVLSNRGWGLLMNTTWRNTIDVGKSDPDRMICTRPAAIWTTTCSAARTTAACWTPTRR